MPFNQVAGFNFAQRLVLRGVPIADGMARTIEWCRKHAPRSPVWSAAAKLDYEGSIPKLRRWLEPMLKRAPAKVTGFYFGINEWIRRPHHAFDMYCVGYARPLRIVKDKFPWRGDPDWNTRSPFARSAIMSDLLPICRKEGGGLEYGDAEYVLVSAYAGLAIRALLTEIPLKTWLKTARRRGVFAGFDEGDFLTVGILTPRGISTP